MAYLKPESPIINWGHPLTQGLVFDAPMFEKSGVGTRDLVTGTIGTFTNTPTWTNGALGAGISFTGNDTDRINFVTKAQQNSVHKISVEIWFIMGSGISNGDRLFHKGSTGVHANRYFQVGEYDGGQMYFAGDWSGAQGAWRITAPSTGVLHHIVVTYDDSSTSNDPVVILNGVVQSTTEVVTPSGTRANDSAILYVGNSLTGTTESWTGTIFLTRYWNRILSLGDARSLNQNPWQIYKQPRFSILDVIAAPAGGTYPGYYGMGGYF